MVKAISHLIHALYAAEHVFTIIAYVSTLYYSFLLYVAVIIVQHLHALALWRRFYRRSPLTMKFLTAIVGYEEVQESRGLHVCTRE